MESLWGLLIPLVGTTAGAACVFLLKNEINPLVQKSLLGFASGVMVAASVWSLLIPAMDMSENMGRLVFIPAAVGLLLGIAFLLILDECIPHQHLGSDTPEGGKQWDYHCRGLYIGPGYCYPEFSRRGCHFHAFEK